MLCHCADKGRAASLMGGVVGGGTPLGMARSFSERAIRMPTRPVPVTPGYFDLTSNNESKSDKTKHY